MADVKVFDQNLEFDNERKQHFFSHLVDGKEPYKQELASIELTEQELFDLALTKIVISPEAFIKEALVSAAKEAVTRSARDAWSLNNGRSTPFIKLDKAEAELLHLRDVEKTYNPRGGELKLTMIAQRAGVAMKKARSWATMSGKIQYL